MGHVRPVAPVPAGAADGERCVDASSTPRPRCPGPGTQRALLSARGTRKGHEHEHQEIDAKIDAVASKAKGAVAKASTLASEAIEKAGRAVDEAEGKVEKLSQKGEHRLYESAEKATHAVEQMTSKAVHATQETMEKVAHGAKELATRVEHRAQESLKTTGGKPAAPAAPPKGG